MINRGDICMVIAGINKGNIVITGAPAKPLEIYEDVEILVNQPAWWISREDRTPLRFGVKLMTIFGLTRTDVFSGENVLEIEANLRKLCPAPEKEIISEEEIDSDAKCPF